MADPVVHLTNGVPDSGTGNVTTLGQTLLDGANVTIGAKADAKSTATDTTAITAISIWKQISASVQAIATSIAGTLTVATHAVTGSGNFAGTVADGADVTLGAKADAKSTATDTTSITIMQVLKQVSASVQSLVTAIGSTAWDLGSGTGGTRTQRWFHDTAQWIGGAGATTAATQRTTLATDSPGIIATGTAGTASSTVLTVQGIAGATPQPVGGVTVTQAASSTITRPADTTAYASGDLVANSTTAGSVTNLQFTTLARVSGGSGVIIGAQIQKSTNSVTNAAFRLHLFNTAPTYTSNGDNTALTTVVVASAKGYLGYIDITAMVGFSDVAWGSGAPDNSRGGIPYVATAQIIYGLLEARGAYTPGNAEVFTVTVDALQD